MHLDLLDTIAIFKDMLVAERCMSQNTVSAYSTDVRNFLNFTEGKIKNNSMQEYLQSKKYASSTTVRKVAAISSWIKFCNTDLELKLDLNIPKVKSYNRVPTIISNKDLDLMISYLQSKNSDFNVKMLAIVKFLYTSGMRISELTKVTREQFAEMLSNKQITIVGKGNKERLVFMNESALEAIKNYVSNVKVKSQYLFATKEGNAMNRQSIHRQLKIVSKRAGVSADRVFPHSFRHRLGSNLNQRGMNLAEIKEILGHKQIKTTLVYTHLDDDWILDAVKKNHPFGAL